MARIRALGRADNVCIVGIAGLCVRLGDSVIPANVKIPAMKSVHLVIPDLFLPKDFAAEVCADLHLPVLRKLLARGCSEMLPPAPLENHLCELFGVPCQVDAPIAPIAAAFDGLNEPGLAAASWLCVAPSHLRLQRDQVLLLPSDDIEATEAAQFCLSLNEYFAGQGMAFYAPHPLRWYVGLEQFPDISCVPLSQVSGRNIRSLLPAGADATRWHRAFNDIQMLLFAHPLNEEREARGLLPVNGVWLWGGGATLDALGKSYGCVSSDDVLAEMFAASSGAEFTAWQTQWRAVAACDRQLLVWTGLRQALQGGDLDRWRADVQNFEAGYAAPLWQALRSGKIDRLQIDVLGNEGVRRVQLARADTWAFWRRSKGLSDYSLT